MSPASLGDVLGDGLEFSATVAAGVLATVISLGTTNAFIASVSRLGYALGRDGRLPASLARTNHHDVPTRGVCPVAAIGAAGLLISFLGNWGTEDIVGIPASLVLVVYLIGTASGARLLSGRARVYAVTAFALTAVIAPFAAAYVLVPVLVAGTALAYRRATAKSRSAGA